MGKEAEEIVGLGVDGVVGEGGEDGVVEQFGKVKEVRVGGG